MSLISLCGGCAEVRAEVPPLIPPYVLRPLYGAGAGTYLGKYSGHERLQMI